MTSEEIQNYLDEHSVKNNEGIYVFETNDETKTFEQTYLSIRKKENRIFDLDTVKQLPYVNRDHQYKSEWDIRSNNAKQLKNYLSKIIDSRFQNVSILTVVDLGCGNGWLSNYLADLTKVNLISIDINVLELKQAAKLKASSNQLYIYADILKTKILPDFSVNIVILNSSFQYFQNFTSLFRMIQPLLKSNFEIHILDTQFYTEEGLKVARDRSIEYYEKNHETKMNKYYYHHTFEEFKKYEFKLLYNPKSIYNRFRAKLRQISPFPWIRISQKI